jgi:hypothetical protein
LWVAASSRDIKSIGNAGFSHWQPKEFEWQVIYGMASSEQRHDFYQPPFHEIRK